MARRRAVLPAALGGLVGLVGLAVLAGCGSQVDPATVAASRGETTVLSADGSGINAGTGTGTGTGGSVEGSDGSAGSIGSGDLGGETSGSSDDGALPSSGAAPGVPDEPGASVVDGAGGGSGGVPAGGAPTSSGAPGPGGGSSASSGAAPSTGASGGALPSQGGAGTAAGSCDGFQNGPGITDDTITIGNSSDLSGPVPGIFQQAQDATRAFAAYFNATTGGICGRTLVVKSYDSRTDAGADQQSYVDACSHVFAMVGSMSAFDSGGADAAQSCGLPDIRSTSVTKERQACATCFAAQSTTFGEVQNVAADYILAHDRTASQHAAFLYVNAGAAAQNAPLQAEAMGRRGLHFDYVQGIDTSEFNYTPYVQALKEKGIQTVFWSGAASMSVRLRQTMVQQGYQPAVYMRDATDYTKEYVDTGGSAVNGTIVFLNFVPFEEASSNPELSLYLGYLDQVDPSAEPGYFGVFAWSAARLFTDLALRLGGHLTRASLVAALRATTSWDGHGIHAVQHPGSKHTGDCLRLVQLHGSTWQPLDGTRFQCDGTTLAS